MLLEKMTPEQRAEIDRFEDRLGEAGWDLEPMKSLLHSGVSMSPEGSADLETQAKSLALDFYLEDRLLLLTIENKHRRVQFEITPGPDIEPLLDWLIGCQDVLNPTSFARHIRDLIPRCRHILHVSADGGRHKLELEQAGPAADSQ